MGLLKRVCTSKVEAIGIIATAEKDIMLQPSIIAKQQVISEVAEATKYPVKFVHSYTYVMAPIRIDNNSRPIFLILMNVCM